MRPAALRRVGAMIAAAVALCAIGRTAPAKASQSAALRVDVRAVAIDALVTRNGRAVTDLAAADFTVLDNGRPQTIDVARLDALPITLLMALDTSASVEGQTLAGLKAAARAATSALGAGDSVGLLTFSDRVRLRLSPTSDLRQLGPALLASTASGETRLYDAVFAALEQRRLSSGRILVLVFSDGADTASWLDPLSVVRAAQRGDAVVHVVSTDTGSGPSSPRDFEARQFLGEMFDREPLLFGRRFLARLVDDTGGRLQSSVARTLGEAFVGIVAEYRSRYLLSYQPTGVDSDGWHSIEVKVRGPGLDVRARRGYQR